MKGTDDGPTITFGGRAVQLFERHPVMVSFSIVTIPSIVAATISLLLAMGFLPGKTPSSRLQELARAQIDSEANLNRRIDSIVVAIVTRDSVLTQRWREDRPIMRAVAIDLCIRLSDDQIAFSELRCEGFFRRARSR